MLKQVTKIMMCLMAFGLWASSASAQSAIKYKFAVSNGTYTSISGTGTSVPGAQGDDVGANITGLPAFTVDGVSYTNARMISNGSIILYNTTAPTTTSNYTPLSTASGGGTSTVVIAPFGRDLNINNFAGTAWWQQVGNEIVFEWKDYNRYGSTGEKINFQARLNTSTGAISFVYGSFTLGTSTTACQIGFKTNGTVASNWATDINNLMLDVTGSLNTCTWSDVVTGNANTSTVYLNTANPGVSPSNGLTYTWTPQANPEPVRTFAAVTGITLSGATVSWTAPTGATQYNVQYRQAGNCGWTNYTGNPVSGTSVSLTGLSSSTSYQVRVQAVNGSNTSIWSHIPGTTGGTSNGYALSGTFSTLCNSASLPWSEGFESMSGVGVGAFPNCWAFENISGTNPGTANDNTTYREPHTGTNFAYSQWSSTNWIFTPGFDLQAGASYTFSFWVREKYSNSTNFQIDVAYGSAQSSAAMTNVLQSGYNTSNAANWTQLTYTVTPAATGTYYFGVKSVCTNSTPWYVSYDDFSMTPPPACNNSTAYGSVAAPTTPTPITITTCNYAGEYATVTGCVAGQQYTFSATGGAGNFLTIRQGTPGGTVLGSGTSPVTVTCTANGSLYMHINTNAACGTDASCHTSTVVCASCTAPPAGCTNSSSYLSVSAPTTPTPITISTCIYAGEYNTVTNCVSGNQYTFTATGGSGNYITIHQGTAGGTIIGAGPSPLTVTCTANGSLYCHINTNSSCGTDASCHTNTVACASCPACTPSITVTETSGTANDGIICSGTSATLSVGAGTSYLWSNGATTQSITVSPAATTAYSVTVTGGSCAGTASRTITVNPTPTATSGSNSPVCVGATLNLTSSGGATYSWSGPGGWTSTLQNPTRTNATAAMAGTYTVTVTSAAGCTATATTDVVVSALPSAVAKADPNPVCTGHFAQLFASGGVSYAWSGPNGFSSTQQSPGLGLAQSNMAGTYTVTVTNESGCSSTASVNLVVNNSPNGTASISTNFACVGSTVQLNASGGQNYMWRGPGGFISNQQNPVINVTSHVQGGEYWVTISNSNGCYQQFVFKLEVGYPPAATASHDQSTACTGSTLKLFGSGVGTYLWTGPAGFTSTQQNPVIANVTPANSGNYTLKVTATNGCSATAVTTVNVVAPPNLAAWADDYDICEFSTAYFHATGASNYEWIGPWGYYSSFQNPVLFYVPTYMTGTYTVKGTGPTGCAANKSFDLRVYQDINGTISATPNPVLLGGTLQLSATGGTSYLWTGPGGFYSTQADPVVNNFNKNNAGIYTVIITNQGGCELTLFVTVNLALPVQGGDVENFTVSTTQIVEGLVFPNPTNNYITLQRHTESSVVYSIIDMHGKVIVKNATTDNGQVNVEALAPGAYNVLWSQPGVAKDAFRGNFIKVK